MLRRALTTAALAALAGTGRLPPTPVSATAPAADDAPVTTAEQVRSLVRCHDLDGLTYCLGQGFVDSPPDYAALTRAATYTTADAEGSGDLSFAAWVDQRAAMSPTELAAAEQAELRTARAGLEKAREIRELGAAPEATAVKPGNAIMRGYQVRQERSYWCGPATMQSIDWGDDRRRESQASWASDLGATSGGTAISAMVQVINAKTRWDAAAGPYIVQSVADWGPVKFYRVHKRHLGDADPAPIVEHPRLLSRHFHYLAKDHSGHYQVGRGYYRKPNGDRMIRIFEVFNESDWSYGGRPTWGPREVTSFDLLAATKANSSFKNIGL